MIEVITRKIPLISQKEVWYYDGSPVELAGRIFFYEAMQPPARPYEEFHTLWSSLELAEDALHRQISDTFRYHIRKAQQIEHKPWFAFDPSDDVLEGFLKTQKDFAMAKGIIPFGRSRLIAMIKAGCFCLTGVSIANQPMIYHAYLTDGAIARLLSSHHVGEQPDTIRGYLNKSLHWHDMLFFKNHGYVTYDWGGVPKPGEGRTFFKESFGGQPRVLYNYTVQNRVYNAFDYLRS